MIIVQQPFYNNYVILFIKIGNIANFDLYQKRYLRNRYDDMLIIPKNII